MRKPMNVYAKVNLLNILRPANGDGRHQRCSVFVPLALHDTVLIDEASKSGVNIDCNYPGVPKDSKSASYRAVEAMARLAEKKLDPNGITVRIRKNIPMDSGLGGSSVDAAAVIIKLNQIWKMGLSKGQLEQIAAKVHPNIPQAIRGRACYAEGYGDTIIGDFQLEPIHVLVAIPQIFLKDAEGSRDAFLCRKIAETEKDEISELLMLAALQERNWDYIAKAMHNDFEATALHFHPELRRLMNKMADHGAIRTLLAGSGGSVFGLFKKHPSIEAIHDIANDNAVKMVAVTETINDKKKEEIEKEEAEKTKQRNLERLERIVLGKPDPLGPWETH